METTILTFGFFPQWLVVQIKAAGLVPRNAEFQDAGSAWRIGNGTMALGLEWGEPTAERVMELWDATEQPGMMTTNSVGSQLLMSRPVLVRLPNLVVLTESLTVDDEVAEYTPVYWNESMAAVESAFESVDAGETLAFMVGGYVLAVEAPPLQINRHAETALRSVGLWQPV